MEMNQKKKKNIDIYIYIIESLFCPVETNTVL